MTVIHAARLVTNWQRLRTAADESSVNRLTFVRRGGLTFDGHERSMARPSCVCGRESGDRRGA